MDDANGNVLKLIKVICPSAEELSVIVNNAKCTQCGLVLKNESRLRLHDLKIHQRKKLEKTDKDIMCIHYHCPEQKCIYSQTSERYFTTMKYLKQHYLKVHAAKSYSCTQCDKSFSTEAAKAAHMRICGLEFTCSCLKTFTSYEALLTHARRLSHYVDEKYKNLLKRTNSKMCSITQVVQISVQKKPVTILPYQENLETVGYQSSTCDSSTQTEDLKKIKKAQTISKTTKRRESRQTQTNSPSKEKRCRKTVETQTISSLRESSKKSTSSRKSKQNLSSETLELNESLTNNLFPSSPLQLHHDVALQDFWEDRNTSGTQTSPGKVLLDVFNDSVTQTVSFLQDENSMTVYPQDYYATTRTSDPMLIEEIFNDRFSSIETQTERPLGDSIFENFGLTSSNTETQTTENFDDIEQLFYTNMCTQTCNEILPSELGLSDTQTQTAWPELEASSGPNDQPSELGGKVNVSETACQSWLNTQTSHTETQTDLLSIFDGLQ